MSNRILTTQENVADKLKRYVRAINVGDPCHLFSLYDETNRSFDLNEDHAAGAHLALVFVSRLDDPRIKPQLMAFQKNAAAYRNGRLQVILITAQPSAAANHEAKRTLGLEFPVLSDPSGVVFAAYGLFKNGDQISPASIRTLTVTPYRRIRCILDDDMTETHADRVLETINQARDADAAAWAPPHAPVLVVPQVFSSEECGQIIREFEQTNELQINRSDIAGNQGNQKIPTYEYGRQDRVDLIIKNPQQIAFFDTRIRERVYPMIKHAFAFDVTHREDFHIARYTGARSGVELGHRDNRTATKYRRFALSVSLNSDYEGGGLVFREFSNRPYRIPAGSAIIFSSSLLHEVEETTKGARYHIISHFFDDLALRQNGGA